MQTASPSKRILQTGRAIRFKNLRRSQILGVVARPRRELTKAHGAQDAAQRLLGDRDTVVLTQDLGQIDQTPAHHAVGSWRRALLHHGPQRLALDRVQARARTGRLAVDQAVRSPCLEGQHPIAHGLQRDPADLRRLRARSAGIVG